MSRSAPTTSAGVMSRAGRGRRRRKSLVNQRSISAEEGQEPVEEPARGEPVFKRLLLHPVSDPGVHVGAQAGTWSLGRPAGSRSWSAAGHQEGWVSARSSSA